MTRGGAQFSTEELVSVLSHYDIGIIEKVSSLQGGSRRAPKRVIVSDKGKFVLKRRSKGRDDLSKVAFGHSVMSHLSSSNFPVARLLTPKNSKTTFLHLNEHIYELFEFVEGIRIANTSESAKLAGGCLGRFHKLLRDFETTPENIISCFHDSSVVRKNLRATSSNEMSTSELRTHSRDLLTYYNDSSIRVNELGFDHWPKQIIHGDWHPGNLLYKNSSIVAVLDYDSVKFGCKISDLANAILQFSIVAGRPNPLDWPDYLDKSKMVHLFTAYCKMNNIIDENQVLAIPDLMVETMIAEAILPIAATGYFANFTGSDFLAMILRKCDWISKHRNILTDSISAVAC